MSVRTRSSARRNSGNSSPDEAEQNVVARPRQRRGAPPPPPPPLPRVVEAVMPPSPAEQQPEKEQPELPPAAPQQETPQARVPDHATREVLTKPPEPWKLMVRTEPTKTNPRRDLVRIWITPSMTPETLATCIQQTCGIDNNFRDWTIAGLFRETDCLFVSLQDIINEQDWKSVYALTFPHFHIPVPQPWLTEKVMIPIGVGSIVALWVLGPTAMAVLHRWSGTFFEVFVNLPLRELYRYGPSIVGWEGASLPSVCARITYHGDEEFWKRNMEECQSIFDSKEEAMLRMVRPGLYVTALVVGFWVIRALVREHAMSLRRNVKAPDQDMIETYRAFNVIFKQMGRAMNDRNQR
jgi:hypothetical protein